MNLSPWTFESAPVLLLASQWSHTPGGDEHLIYEGFELRVFEVIRHRASGNQWCWRIRGLIYGYTNSKVTSKIKAIKWLRYYIEESTQSPVTMPPLLVTTGGDHP